MERVVIVDRQGRRIGTEEKIQAHAAGGTLHLAFCVFVLDAAGRLLLQRRADQKYHFPGLWSNSCCGHPRPGEGVVAAAERRLGEEFGFTTALRPVTAFTYYAEDAVSGLAEHEYAHVLVGRADGCEPAPAPEEIGDWCWLAPPQASADAACRPGRYTPWFRRLITEQPVSAWLE
ncbi:isopentenyl-diphosphate Delta-isomerase [Halorhodospira neutriphila]|uniref:Isopentenyl-diphosphate Delta-isomerase n=1 Tax=Halorhodospira neutriphila TaxID=168379 RepID=A0ABS1E7N5_9GAMM|nr:isopentenyl-diphosphate Delta-isomerase [Halorhodospira neutriphila]MBK1727189.1 isopentenyl-diphosphate delta-isomerase [Halorhodospira neutriphila]